MKKPDKLVLINATTDSFFKEYLTFLKPFHDLTERETDVAAAFLKERYELSKKIISEELLNSVLMSEEGRRKIKDACGLTPSHFQVILGKLKKSGFIKDGKLNEKLTVTPTFENDSFTLMLYFRIKEDENQTKTTEQPGGNL